MAFCRAFQSLPAKVLEDSFGPPGNGGKYASVGLNVISPLLQSQTSALDEMSKLPFLAALSSSPDPEIKQWLQNRGATRQSHTQILAMSKNRLGPNCIQSLISAMHHLQNPPDPTSFSFQSPDDDGDSASRALQTISETWKATTENRISFTNPCGLASSRIALILDHGEVKDEPAIVKETTDSTLRPPWGIIESGFTNETCRIWTLAFSQYSELSLAAIELIQEPKHETQLTKLHRDLIQNSSHRVIFLCGPNVRRVILEGIPPSTRCKLKLELDLCEYEVYLEKSSPFPRLYLYCPEVPPDSALKQWATARRLDMIIKFAAVVTGTQRNRSGLFERAGAVLQIIRQAREERRGGAKLTCENLDINLRAWLHRKGITEDSDIREVEKAAGSLTRGLLMLLHLLPRDPRSTSTASAVLKNPTRKRLRQSKPFDRSEFEAVAQIYKKAKASVEKDVLENLTSATQDTKPDSVVDMNQSIQNEGSGQGTILETELGSLNSELPGEADYAAFNELLASNPTWETEFDTDKIESREFKDILSLAHIGNPQIGQTLGNVTEGVRDDRPHPTTFSRPSTRHLGVAQYPWQSGKRSKEEWETKHKTEGYRATAPDKVHSAGRVVTLCYMMLTFPSHWEFGERFITIFPEFSAPGTRNPDVYATAALESDPASRLAIRACGKLKDGEEFSIYMHRDTEQAVFAANAFADRVLDGIDKRDLHRRPRRYVHPPQRSR